MILALSVCACGGKQPQLDAARSSSADSVEAAPASVPERGPATLATPSTTFPAPIINEPALDCPELPPLAKQANKVAERAAQLAAVMRRVACDPQLYALSTATLAKTLRLPPGVLVRFNSANGINLAIQDMPPTRALAAALGIDEPVARLDWDAYHDQWWLGSNAETGELDRFGPGVINIGLSHDAEQDDPQGKVVALEDSMQAGGGVIIAMPDEVVSLGPDPEGLAQLAAAMSVLAATPDLMNKEPVDVARKLGLVHERFRVARASVHTGKDELDGISFQPMRTRIPADELAAAIGLEDAKAQNVNREHDVWQVSVAGSTQLKWRGIVLEIEIEVADGNDRTTALAGAAVEFITMRSLGE